MSAPKAVEGSDRHSYSYHDISRLVFSAILFAIPVPGSVRNPHVRLVCCGFSALGVSRQVGLVHLSARRQA